MAHVHPIEAAQARITTLEAEARNLRAEMTTAAMARAGATGTAADEAADRYRAAERQMRDNATELDMARLALAEVIRLSQSEERAEKRELARQAMDDLLATVERRKDLAAKVDAAAAQLVAAWEALTANGEEAVALAASACKLALVGDQRIRLDVTAQVTDHAATWRGHQINAAAAMLYRLFGPFNESETWRLILVAIEGGAGHPMTFKRRRIDMTGHPVTGFYQAAVSNFVEAAERSAEALPHRLKLLHQALSVEERAIASAAGPALT